MLSPLYQGSPKSAIRKEYRRNYNDLFLSMVSGTLNLLHHILNCFIGMKFCLTFLSAMILVSLAIFNYQSIILSLFPPPSCLALTYRSIILSLLPPPSCLALTYRSIILSLLPPPGCPAGQNRVEVPVEHLGADVDGLGEGVEYHKLVCCRIRLSSVSWK